MSWGAAETSLVAKALWSAAIVLGLAALAERVSTRIAGILSGAPQNAVLVYFFVGYDMGTDYVVESVPHGIAAFTATLAFMLTYYLASSVLVRFAAPGSALTALAVFIAVAAALARVPFTVSGALALTIGAIVVALWLLRRVELVAVARPVRYTPRLLLLRGLSAVVLILCVIALAEALGTRWAGLLTGFPTALLPTLLIIHLTYGKASTHAMIRNFPLGVGSIVVYMLSVPVTFPRWGVGGGTAASLALSLVYLTVVMLWGRPATARAAVSPPGP